MMETFKCPVCGKTGIPDYLNENVICPNCNSDLGIYKTLNTIEKGNNDFGGQVRKYKNLAMVLSALTVLLLGVLAFVYFNKDNNPQIIETSDAKVKELRDSISTLYAQIESQKRNCRTASLSSLNIPYFPMIHHGVLFGNSMAIALTGKLFLDRLQKRMTFGMKTLNRGNKYILVKQ